MQKGFTPILILVGIAVILAIAGGAYYFGKSQTINPQSPVPQDSQNPSAIPQACTNEAMVCPDGSAVGRTGPNCEFAPCPSVAPKIPDETTNWKTYTNDSPGISFKYPPNTNIDTERSKSFITGNDGVELTMVPPNTSSYEMQYIFNFTSEENKSNLNTKQVIDNYLSKLENSKDGPGMKETANKIRQTIKPYINNNISGLIGIYGWETEFLFLVEVKGNKIYSFSIHDGNGYTNDYVLKLFDQILSTFKFTN